MLDLYVYLLEAALSFMARWPHTGLSVNVDDFAISQAGAHAKIVVAELAAAWAWIMCEVQQGLKLLFSMTKTKVLASTPEASAALRDVFGRRFGVSIELNSGHTLSTI